MTAFAVGLAVLPPAAQTGEGQHVQSSLSQTATYHQTPYMLDYQGKTYDEPRGWQALGTGPLQRFYQAQDGWFFLGRARPEAGRRRRGRRGSRRRATWTIRRWSRRWRRASRPGTAGDLGRAATRGRHQRARRRPLPRLDGRSVGTRARARASPRCSEEVGEVTYPGPSPRLSETPVQLGAPVRQPGADAQPSWMRSGLARRDRHAGSPVGAPGPTCRPAGNGRCHVRRNAPPAIRICPGAPHRPLQEMGRGPWDDGAPW